MFLCVFYDDNTEVHNFLQHSLTAWFPHTTLVIKDHNFFVEYPIDLKFSGSNVMLLKYYKTIPCFSGDEQTVRNYVYFFKTSFKESVIFRTAPGTDDGHFSFFFLSTIKKKWKFTNTKFPIQWMKIMRDMTQLHKLSEQPTYKPDTYTPTPICSPSPSVNEICRRALFLWSFDLTLKIYHLRHYQTRYSLFLSIRETRL